MLSLILSLSVILMVVFMLTKKYSPPIVLFSAGILLMLLTIIFQMGSILPISESTGDKFFDIFEFIKSTFSNRTATLGINIMAVGGFSRYMSHIGASKVLARIVLSPVQRIQAPYVFMSVMWITGLVLGLFINSASSLSMLLMVTVFPVLIELGVSRLAASATVATTLCMDWSPAETASILAAHTSGMDIADYWLYNQVPVTLCVAVVVIVLNYFTQRYFDKKERFMERNIKSSLSKVEDNTNLPDKPIYYGFLPAMPISLILGFSSIGISWIKMDLANAIFISLFISLIVDLIHSKSIEKLTTDVKVFFDEFGKQMSTVILLVIAGETFAHSLQTIGSIDYIIQWTNSMELGKIGMILVFVTIIAGSAIIMGSSAAPFFAFFPLTPKIAESISVPIQSILIPMQFSASLARSISPISSVIIVTAGMAEVSPIELVKRTLIPMIGGFVVMLISSLYIIR